ncbi:hypothetical protein [Brucella intermedia]|uniref:hypothetical protein n=1 Tax=Brucella intermedia TaxID=94625 RepID=UPI00124F64FA|nr:hypothetical protein [Brucella intermedia]KAB2724329.1 hypothetical protein F9L02_21190 [Brucella intermedia]
MKNPVRNVVVEYKNKRARKGNFSIWGNIDLKSIAREVEADATQAPVCVPAVSDLPALPDNKAEVFDQKDLPQTVPASGAVEVGRKPVAADVVETASGVLASDREQEPENAAQINVRQKNPSIQRGSKNRVLQKTKTAYRIASTIDIHAELSFLEQENASLRRELIAKLRAENANLYAMLQLAEQRFATRKR